MPQSAAPQQSLLSEQSASPGGMQLTQLLYSQN
jgi:hypothetical protein